MSNTKHPSYTDKFRREAVRRADEPGASATHIARDLGINVNMIYNWRSQFKKIDRLKSGETVKHQFHNVDGVDYSKSESEELRKLRKEVVDLKEERDFLKKAAAYFSNQK